VVGRLKQAALPTTFATADHPSLPLFHVEHADPMASKEKRPQERVLLEPLCFSLLPNVGSLPAHSPLSFLR
jgi:hypothetical protein